MRRNENIWGGGVSNTIGLGTVKLFHSPKFSVEHILYKIPDRNGVHNELHVLRKGQ